MDLEGPVHGSVRELAGVELRLCRGEGEVAALVLEPRSLVDEIPAGLELRGHVRQLEPHRLERRDWLPELLPFLRVRIGEIVRTLREPDAHRSDRDPPAVQDLQELPEALTPRAEAAVLSQLDHVPALPCF